MLAAGLLFLSLVTRIAIGALLPGASLTLAWKVNASPEVVGYKVYYGTNSGVYTDFISVGLTNSATIYNLLNGVEYYISAVAVGADGMESALSNELIYAPGGVERPVRALLQMSLNAQRQPVLRANVVPGKIYELEVSSDLLNWVPITSLIGSANGMVSYTDAAAPALQRRYYRLREV